MASTYLSRTPSSSGSNTTWTFSCWLKRTALGLDTVPFATGYTSPQIDECLINLGTDDQLRFNINVNDVTDVTVKSSRKLRDINAWYHLVVKCDTTQATASDRIKIYINGEEETNLATADYPTQNQSTFFGDTSKEHKIGLQPRTSNYLNGIMTHIHFTDGTAYTASTFGESDANGVWKPKTAPSVTYGTNGFFLKMENSGSMGTDSSGNGNNFTVNGTLTQTLDTPSNVYATLNPLIPIGANFSNGNLTHSTTSGGYKSAFSTLGMTTGKWYCEMKFLTDSDYTGIGVANIDKGNINAITYIGDSTNGVIFQAGSQTLYYNGGNPSWTGTSCVNGDIIGIALDIDNGFIYWHKNGTYMNSGVPTSGATGTGGYAVSNIANSDGTGTYTFGLSTSAAGGTRTITCNFGNGYFGTSPVSSAGSNGNGSIFEYDVPTGYYALNTKNLATYG